MAKTTKRKPGRPPKPQDEKPTQFSIRLPQDVKIGLEVLAADSNLSLSSAVELAVGQMLAAQKLSNGMTPEEVVAKIETQPIAARLMALYRISPRFLEFQDRALVETIFASTEFQEAEAETDQAKRHRKTMEAAKFVIDNWRAISSALQASWAKRAKTGSYSLRGLLEPPTPPPEDSGEESLFFRKTA